MKKVLAICLLLLLPLGCSYAEPGSPPAEELTPLTVNSASVSPATFKKRQEISRLTSDLLNDRIDSKNGDFTDQLLAALSHEDAVVRQQAAAGLSSVNFDTRIVDPLLAVLSTDQDGVARVYASMAISQWCTYGYLKPAALSERQQDILVTALSDEHRFVRANIVGSVFASTSSIINDKSVAALGLLLKDQDDRVRSNAVSRAVGLGGGPQMMPLIETLMNIVEDTDEVTHIRRDAIWALMHTLDDRVTPLLQKVLQDEDATLRVRAVEAIGFICRAGNRGHQPVGDILPLLSDPNEDVRKAAISALETVSGEELGENRARWQQWYDEKRLEK
jgi:vesicle coat complex subunit